MITELGHFALLLGFMVAILQSTVPLIGVRLNHYGAMHFGRTAASAGGAYLPSPYPLGNLTIAETEGVL